MRLLAHTLLVATTIGLSLALTPACVDNDESIYIRQVMAPPTTKTGGSCTYTPDVSQPALFEGAMDVALHKDNYSAVILIGNQMIQRGDNLAARSETNKAHINGAIVRVTDANGNEISEFTSQSVGFVDAANGAIASVGLMAITMLDAPTVNKIAGNIDDYQKSDQVGPNGEAPEVTYVIPRGQSKLILANVKAFGETLGGVDLESAEFQFPIRVCNGCLINFNSDDPLTKGVDCNLTNSTAAAGGAAAGTADTGPCQFGQDEGVACTLCRAGFKACQSDPIPPPLP